MTSLLWALSIAIAAAVASGMAFAQDAAPVQAASQVAPPGASTSPTGNASSDTASAAVAKPGNVESGNVEAPSDPTRRFDGTEPPATPVKLVVVGDRVSAELEGVDRGAVLAAIAEQTDIEFVVVGDDASSRVTASFDATPLSEAIEVVLAGAKTVSVYVGEGEERRLSRVFVVIDADPSTSTATLTADDARTADEEQTEAATVTQPDISDEVSPEVRQALQTVQEQVAASDFLERLGEVPVEGDIEVPADVERQLEELIRQRIPAEMLEQRAPPSREPPATP